MTSEPPPADRTAPAALWLCPYCRQQPIAAGDTRCPGCGQAFPWAAAVAAAAPATPWYRNTQALMLLLVALQLAVFGYQSVLFGRQADLATMDRQERTQARIESTEKARRDAFDKLLYLGDGWGAADPPAPAPCASDCRAVPLLAAASRQYEWRHGAAAEEAPFDDAVGRAAQVVGDLQINLSSNATLLEQKGKRAELMSVAGGDPAWHSASRFMRDAMSCGGQTPPLLFHASLLLQLGAALDQLFDARRISELADPDPQKRHLAQQRQWQRWSNPAALPGRPLPDEQQQAAADLARVDQAVRSLRQLTAEREPPQQQALSIASTGDLIDAVRAAARAHGDEIDRFIAGCDEQIRRYGEQLGAMDASRR